MKKIRQMPVAFVFLMMAFLVANSAFGSDASLLNHCWTADELIGHPDELVEKPIPRDAGRRPLRPILRALASAPGVVSNVEAMGDKKWIALTFDVCETRSKVYGYDYRVIDFLRSQQVPATLFISGHWMQTHSERMQQLIADPLFEIGNHSWSHPNFEKMAPEYLESQVSWTEGMYETIRDRLLARPCAQAVKPDAAKKLSPLFRFPFGTCKDDQIASVDKMGYKIIHWNVVSGDPDPSISAERMARVIIERAKPGSIIIGHANGRGHRIHEAIKTVVLTLREKGWEFVTVSRLLAAGSPHTEKSCTAKIFEVYPGDKK